MAAVTMGKAVAQRATAPILLMPVSAPSFQSARAANRTKASNLPLNPFGVKETTMLTVTLVKGTRDAQGDAEYLVDGVSVWAKDQTEAVEKLHERQIDAINRRQAQKVECFAAITKAIAAGGRTKIDVNFPPARLVAAAAEIGWIARSHTRENDVWLFIALTEAGLDALKSATDRDYDRH